MPRTRSLAWSELKVGVLTLTAIVIAAVLIFSLTGSKGFSWQRYTLKTRFGNVAGLAKGSPVRVAGVEVGSVKEVDFAGAQVDVVFEVKDDLRSRITDKSLATLGSVSLLGESAIDITPATSGTPIPDNGYVPSGKPPSSLSDLTDKAGQGIEQLSSLITDVRQGKGTMGKLITDEQLYTELNQFVATAGTLTRELQQGRGTLGKLLKDPKAAQSLETSMKNIEEMTRRINAGEGSIGRLMKDDAFAQSLNGATSSLKELTDKLNRGEGTAGKLVTDPALFNRLTSVTDRFDQLVSKLNEGEGTAGRLLKDKQLYENMNGAVSEFRALLEQIKKEPKKYLNVRVSIF
jgi:phospholipid/cholesterol/gamma-HCH transport system substrate-binding protein